MLQQPAGPHAAIMPSGHRAYRVDGKGTWIDLPLACMPAGLRACLRVCVGACASLRAYVLFVCVGLSLCFCVYTRARAQVWALCADDVPRAYVVNEGAVGRLSAHGRTRVHAHACMHART